MDQNPMENAIRPPRAHFHLLFCLKSNLGLSWRHLGGILGRLGKIVGPSWDPKTPPRCPKINQNRPQEPPQRLLEGVPEASEVSCNQETPKSCPEPSRPRFWCLRTWILEVFFMDFGKIFGGFTPHVLPFFTVFGD